MYMVAPSELLGISGDLAVVFPTGNIGTFTLGAIRTDVETGLTDHELIYVVGPFVTPIVATWLRKQENACYMLPMMGGAIEPREIELMKGMHAQERAFFLTLISIAKNTELILKNVQGFKLTHVGPCSPDRLQGVIWHQVRGDYHALILFQGNTIEGVPQGQGLRFMIDGRYEILVDLDSNAGIRSLSARATLDRVAPRKLPPEAQEIFI